MRGLLDYNRWANHAVMDRAKEVAEPDYSAIGKGLRSGSLHATLVYIMTGDLV